MTEPTSSGWRLGDDGTWYTEEPGDGTPIDGPIRHEDIVLPQRRLLDTDRTLKLYLALIGLVLVVMIVVGLTA